MSKIPFWVTSVVYFSYEDINYTFKTAHIFSLPEKAIVTQLVKILSVFL